MMELATMQALDRAQQTVRLLELTNQYREDKARLASAKGGYSLTRALRSLAEDRPGDAPLERDASEQIAERLGRQPRPGFVFVPTSQRDLTAGTGSAGGYLVGAAAQPGDVFADALRASSVMLALGVREVPMGPANQTIPKLGDATGYWLTTEATTITETDVTSYGGIALSPKTVGAYMEASRNWMQATTPQAQGYVLRGLAAVVAAAVDAALIQGTGSNGQPTGLIGAAGVATASGATMSMTKLVTTIKDVENANGIRTPSATGWAVAADAAAILRVRERAAGSGFLFDAGRIDGRPAAVSNSVPAGTAIFGDWSQIVLATWGVLEVGTDPYGATSGLFKTGITGIRALWTVDVGVLQGASFSKLTSIS